jgi:putative NADH-flavin reductase
LQHVNLSVSIYPGEKMKQHIAIIGASKGIGLATVKEALARGHHVTALARNPAALAAENLTWVRGDALDPVVLKSALHGASAVVTTLGVPETGATTLFSDVAKQVIAEMQSQSIPRLLAVTGFGTGDGRGRGGFMYDRIFYPLLLARLYADKEREEALIRASKLDWTIVRPGRLTNSAKTGKVQVLKPANYRFGPISRADVAGFNLDCIEKADFIKANPVIIG